MKCLRPSRKDDNHLTPPGVARRKSRPFPARLRRRAGCLAPTHAAAHRGAGAAAFPVEVLGAVLAAIKPVILSMGIVLVAVGITVAAALTAGIAFAGEAERELVERLKKGGVEQRRQALRGLGRRGGEGAVPALVESLRDFDLISRGLAEQALWSIWMRSGDARVDALLRNGTRLMAEGELKQAVEAFDSVIRLRPGFAEGYNKRATAMYHLGRFQRSLDDIAETLRRNPYHFGALSGGGLCMLGLQRPREAMNFFQRALRINPNMKGIVELKKRVESLLRKPMT